MAKRVTKGKNGPSNGAKTGVDAPSALPNGRDGNGSGSTPNLSSFIWSVADLLRGDYRQSEYGRVILPFNDLFEGDLTDEDKLVYVNNVIKGKLLESEILQQQAANNTKERFASSPTLNGEMMSAIMDALDAHTAMSTQALNSLTVREGMKDILLNYARLWEELRERATSSEQTL